MTFLRSLNKLLPNRASKPSWLWAILDRDLMACKQKQEFMIKKEQNHAEKKIRNYQA